MCPALLLPVSVSQFIYTWFCLGSLLFDCSVFSLTRTIPIFLISVTLCFCIWSVCFHHFRYFLAVLTFSCFLLGGFWCHFVKLKTNIHTFYFLAPLCSMQDLSSQFRTEPFPPGDKGQSLKHWTAKEVSISVLLYFNKIQVWHFYRCRILPKGIFHFILTIQNFSL